MPVIKPQTKPLSRVELLLHACLSCGIVLQIMRKSGSFVTPPTHHSGGKPQRVGRRRGPVSLTLYFFGGDYQIFLYFKALLDTPVTQPSWDYIGSVSFSHPCT